MLKCTSFFSMGNGGWSETWFLDGSNVSAGTIALQNLNLVRLALCPATVTLIGRRVSIVENPAIVNASSTNLVGTNSASRDVLNAALLWQATAANGAKRQVWTRGVPDEQIVSGAYAGVNGYPTLTLAWQQAIISNSFAIRSIDRTVPIVNALAVDGNGVVTFLADPGWFAGDTVRFFRSKNSLGKTIKKSYRIALRTNGLTYTLNGWPAGVTALNPRARRIVPTLFVPVVLTIVKAGTRRTGRPFNLPVGRRRAAAA